MTGGKRRRSPLFLSTERAANVKRFWEPGEGVPEPRELYRITGRRPAALSEDAANPGCDFR